MENLSTMVSISQERCFPNVDFIDTPGLVDGSVEYPFDVNQVLLFLADMVDLIFVFLDPHEQALGSRTMEVVKMLNVCLNVIMHIQIPLMMLLFSFSLPLSFQCLWIG